MENSAAEQDLSYVGDAASGGALPRAWRLFAAGEALALWLGASFIYNAGRLAAVRTDPDFLAAAALPFRIYGMLLLLLAATVVPLLLFFARLEARASRALLAGGAASDAALPRLMVSLPQRAAQYVLCVWAVLACCGGLLSFWFAARYASLSGAGSFEVLGAAARWVFTDWNYSDGVILCVKSLDIGLADLLVGTVLLKSGLDRLRWVKAARGVMKVKP